MLSAHQRESKGPFPENAQLCQGSRSDPKDVADVLSRPRIRDKYGITEADIMELLILIDEKCEHVLLSRDIEVCRDPADSSVIETAIKGRTSCIVSRDDDIKFDKNVATFLSRDYVTAMSTARFLQRIKEPT